MGVAARGLPVAEEMIMDERLEAAVHPRHAGWNTAHGQAVLAGSVSLAELADQVLAAYIDGQPVSGRQQALENLVNRFCGN